jgi:2'-5' RNA ligase
VTTESGLQRKYLVVATFSGTLQQVLEEFLQEVAEIVGREVRGSLPLHLTLHPSFWLDPNEVSHLETVRIIIGARVRRCKSSQITICGPMMFGREFYVLPVAPSLGVARLWVGLHEAFTNLSLQGPKREFWIQNIPHVTLAKNLSGTPEIVGRLRRLDFPAVSGDIETVHLYAQGLVGEEGWTEVATYKLS